MIKPTDEMTQAYVRAACSPGPGDIRAGLAAVLAIVERDVLQPAIEEAYGRGRDDEASDLGIPR